MAKTTHTGVVIGENAIEWFSLVSDGDRTVPGGSGRVELEAPIIQALAGNGEFPDEAIAKLKSEVAGISGAVSVGLSGGNVLLRMFHLPASEPEEIKSMVALQVDKISPFPIENMVVSHEVLGRHGGNVVVAAAAVKQDVVEAVGKFLHKLGIVPYRVDLCPLAWWHGIAGAGILTGKGREAILLMAGIDPELIVTQDGLPILFRSPGKSEHSEGAEFADEIADEINYSLMSIEMDHGGAAACRLIVVSDRAGQDHLAEKLRSGCGCEVVSKPVSSIPSPTEGIARRLALGTGVDLTPDVIRHERGQQAYKKKMILGVAAGLCIWLGGVLVIGGGIAVERFRISRLTAEKGRLAGSVKEVVEMRSRVNTILRYMDRKTSVLECMREIVVLKPEGVDLSSISYRKGESVRIAGDSSGVNPVYDFKKQLDASTLFKGCTLQGPKRSKDKETFEIECKLPAEMME